MTEPTFDRNGYPTEETLDTIEKFPTVEKGPWAFMEFVTEAWDEDYGRIICLDGKTVEFVTGGWSGNEEIISAIKRNIFHALYWQSSHRGGLDVFIIPSK